MALHLTRFVFGAAVLAFATASVAAPPNDPASIQSHCSHKTNRTYGFICQGFALVNPNVGLEPITQVGTVTGSPTGFFEGYGTISASIGSLRQHLRGQFSGVAQHRARAGATVVAGCRRRRSRRASIRLPGSTPYAKRVRSAPR